MSELSLEEIKVRFKGRAFNFGRDLSKEEQTTLLLACRNDDMEAFDILFAGIDSLLNTVILNRANALIKNSVYSWDEIKNDLKGVVIDGISKFDIKFGNTFITYIYTALVRRISRLYYVAQKNGDFDPNKVSLDDTVRGKDGDDGRTYYEFLADTSDETANFEGKILDKVHVDSFFKLLPKDYLFVVTEYYLNQKSLRKIAGMQGVSRETIRTQINSATNLIKYINENPENTPDFSYVKGNVQIKNLIALYQDITTNFEILDFKTEIYPYLSETEKKFFKATMPVILKKAKIYDEIDLTSFKLDKIDFNIILDKLRLIKQKKEGIIEFQNKFGEEAELFSEGLSEEEKLIYSEYLMSLRPETSTEFKKRNGIETQISVAKLNIIREFTRLHNNKIECDIFAEENGGYNFLYNFFPGALDEREKYILFNYLLNYKREYNAISIDLKTKFRNVYKDIDEIKKKLDIFFGRVVRNRYYNGKRIDTTRYSVVETWSINLKKRYENLKKTDNLTLDDLSDCYPKLSRMSQSVLAHYLINGYPISDIAIILCVKKGNVYDRFLSAKREVKDLLAMDYQTLPDNESVVRKTQMFWKPLYLELKSKIESIDVETELLPSLDEKYKFVLENLLSGRGDKLLSKEARNLKVSRYGKLARSLIYKIDKVIERKQEISYFIKQYGGKEVVDDFRSVLDDRGKVVLDNYILSCLIDAYTRTKKLINQPTYNIIAKKDWIYKTFDELEEKKEQSLKFIDEHGGREFLEDFCETLIPNHQFVLKNFLMDYHYLTQKELATKLGMREDYLCSAVPDIMENFERYCRRREDIDAIISSVGGREVIESEFCSKLKEIQKAILEKSILAYNPVQDKEIAQIFGVSKSNVQGAKNIVLEKFKKFCEAKASGRSKILPTPRRSREEFVERYGKEFLLETFSPSILTEREQKVLNYVMIGGMTYNQYSEISGKSEATIHSVMTSIKKKLSAYDKRKRLVDKIVEDAGGEALVAEKLFKNLSEKEQIIFVNSLVSYFPSSIGILMKKANVSKAIGYQIIEYLEAQVERLTKEKENYQFVSFEEYKALKNQRAK